MGESCRVDRARALGPDHKRAWTGSVLNVNLPHPEPGGPDPEVIFCPVDASPLPLRFRLEGDLAHYVGDYHLRTRRKSSDVDVCFGGQIAVSLVHLFGSAESAHWIDSAGP